MVEGLPSSRRVDDFLDSVSKISQERERESTKRQRSLESNIDDLRQRLGSRSPNKRESSIELGDYNKGPLVEQQGSFLLNASGIARSPSFDEEVPPPMPERKKEIPPPFPKRPWERNHQARGPSLEAGNIKDQAFAKGRSPPPKPKRPVENKSLDSKLLAPHSDNRLLNSDFPVKNTRPTDTSLHADVTKNDIVQKTPLEIKLITPVSSKPKPGIPPNTELGKSKTNTYGGSRVLLGNTKHKGLKVEYKIGDDMGTIQREETKVRLDLERKPFRPEKPPVLSVENKKKTVTIEERLASLLVEPTQLRRGRTGPAQAPYIAETAKENNREKLPLKKFLLKEEELLESKVKLLAIHRQQHKTPPPKPSKPSLSSYEEKDALQLKSQISRILSKEPPRIPKKPAFADYQRNDSDEIRNQIKKLGKEKSSAAPTNKALEKPSLSEGSLKTGSKPEGPQKPSRDPNTLTGEDIKGKHPSPPSKPVDFGSELSLLLSKKSTAQLLAPSPKQPSQRNPVNKEVETKTEENIKSPSLTHLNRLRAKGPKRKLPKNMASSQVNNVEQKEQVPSEYQKSKKLPPIVNKRGKQRALDKMKPRNFSGEVFV